jgi:hypothetical protein
MIKKFVKENLFWFVFGPILLGIIIFLEYGDTPRTYKLDGKTEIITKDAVKVTIPWFLNYTYFTVPIGQKRIEDDMTTQMNIFILTSLQGKYDVISLIKNKRELVSEPIGEFTTEPIGKFNLPGIDKVFQHSPLEINERKEISDRIYNQLIGKSDLVFQGYTKDMSRYEIQIVFKTDYESNVDSINLHLRKYVNDYSKEIDALDFYNKIHNRELMKDITSFLVDEDTYVHSLVVQFDHYTENRIKEYSLNN